MFNATSAKKLSVVPNVEPALNPYQPTHSRSTPRPTRGIECPGIARGDPSEPYLPRRRSEEQQSREAADRTGEVDHRRTGEVHDGLAADVGQETAAVDGVRHERVDHRGEDRRVDHVRRELDPLERRSPDDRQGDRAEQHPEQHQGRVGAADEVRVSARADRLAVVEEEPVGAEDVVARQRRDPEADGPPGERRDRQVDHDLGDAGSHVLLAGEADLEQQEPSLHQQDENAADHHPCDVQLALDRVDALSLGRRPALAKPERPRAQAGRRG